LVDSNKQDIIQILESTRKGIQSGSVSVKDTDKSLLQIDEILSLVPDSLKKFLFLIDLKVILKVNYWDLTMIS